MAYKTFPFFQLIYIDYICTIDDRDTRIIWHSTDRQWYDLEDGPTVLADELGSIIEGRTV